MAETINGLYKADVIWRQRSWRSASAVELANLRLVEWFNNYPLFGPIGHIPPVEAEANYYLVMIGGLLGHAKIGTSQRYAHLDDATLLEASGRCDSARGIRQHQFGDQHLNEGGFQSVQLRWLGPAERRLGWKFRLVRFRAAQCGKLPSALDVAAVCFAPPNRSSRLRTRNPESCHPLLYTGDHHNLLTGTAGSTEHAESGTVRMVERDRCDRLG